MRKSLTTWLGIFGGAGLCLAAHAITPNPSREQYRDIPERNVFGLKADQPAAEPTAPKGPPPKLTLTGITTILGNKLVLLRAALPAAPGVPAQEKPLMLSEGQRDGNIEVLEINEQQRSVRVNDAGEIVTLTFVRNGVKGSTAPATAAGTPPSNAPALPYSPGFNPRMRVLPTRTPRTPMASAAPETGAAATPGAAAAAATNAAVAASAAAVAPSTPAAADTGLSPTGRVPTDNPATPQEGQLSPEAQALLQSLQQQQQQQEQQQQGANYDNANPAPLPPASSAGSPLPVIPPGANLQRARPPFYPQ